MLPLLAVSHLLSSVRVVSRESEMQNENFSTPGSRVLIQSDQFKIYFMQKAQAIIFRVGCSGYKLYENIFSAKRTIGLSYVIYNFNRLN
jgi:hypothetical protein